MNRKSFLPILICSLLLLGACGGDSTGPDMDNGNGDGGNGNDNSIGTEPTFTNIQQILDQSCSGSGCHINQRTNGVRLNNYQNVVESEGSQYGELVVQAGDADGSPLVDKIEPNPEEGVRMPENGNYLSEERIDQIREWINNGAEDN